MKRLTLWLLTFLITASLLSFTSCSGGKDETSAQDPAPAITLSGTYAGKTQEGPEYYSFKGSRVVLIDAKGLYLEGAYTIKSGKMTITWSKKTMEEANLWIKKETVTMDFSQGDDFITLDGIKYTKEPSQPPKN